MLPEYTPRKEIILPSDEAAVAIAVQGEAMETAGPPEY
jgi:hypothetical protein